MVRSVPSVAVLLAAVLAACSSSGGDEAATTSTTAAPTTTATTVPIVEDVYAVPDPLPAGEPGDVLQVEPLDDELAGLPGVTGWRVLYHSRSIQGDDIPVSGVVLRPAGTAPSGGFPVVTWAHGTTGTADRCAPSKEAPFIPSLDELLGTGHVVVATDYEGLGTPGLHPYLLGESEGRGVLDAVRAAQRMEGVDAGSDVVVWGHSQGGHAAVFAFEVAGDYAPELDVRGVVAMAPAGDLALIGNVALTSPQVFPFGFMALGTWAEEYPELDLDALLAPPALDRLPILDDVCAPAVFDAFAGLPASELFATAAPMDVPPLRELLLANSVGERPLDGPVLVVHGDADDTVPVELSHALLPKMCAAGAAAELRVYPGASHSTVLAASSADVLAWTADRFDGVPVDVSATCP
jgi:alpha-beta hydrolase superfamily lysophospholipase